MANTRKPFPMEALLADFKQAGFNPQSLTAIRQLFARTDVTTTDVGELRSTVPVQGRTEPLSTTVVNHNSDGTFNSTDNVRDGIVSTRSYQQSGSALVIDNSGFELPLVLGQIPGWQVGSASAIALDIGNPQSGKQALKVTFSGQFQAAQSLRSYTVKPGDTFRISGFVRSDGVAAAYIAFSIFDKNGNLLAQAGTGASNSIAWVPVSGTVVAPVNSAYGQIWLSTSSVAVPQTAWFDTLQGSRTLTSFELTPINTAGTPQSTTGLCTQHSAGSTRIDVTSSTWQFGDGTVAYNSGFVDPGVLGTYYIYADDPGYAGGSITYVATLTPSVANAANGRLFFGKITTAAGTATSAGGGSGGGGPFSKAALA